MPEEYVYKIVIDDSEVATALDKIDRQVINLTQKMDGMFRGVGAGAGAGLEQASQQVEQASQRMSRAQSQSAQEMQRSQQQTAQGAETAARRTGQASMQSTRTQVQNAREVVRSRQEEQRSLQAAASQAHQQASVAQQTAATRKRAWEDAKTAVVNALAAQKQAEEEYQSVSKDASAGEKARLQQRVADRTADVQQAQSAVKTTAKGHVQAARAAEDAGTREKEASRSSREGAKQVTAAKSTQRKAEQALGRETRNSAKITRANAKEQRQAERLFVRTSKTYGKQRKELDQLAKKYGSFTVTLGKSTDQLDKHEKEVYDVIKSDKQLSQEIDKLTTKYGKFDAKVDRATFAGGPQVGVPRTQFRQAGFALGRAGVPGAATLGEAAAVGGVAGVAAVGVLMTVKQLISAFQKLASMAVDAFKKIVSGSIEAAKEIEVARAQFGAFFEQDTVAAEAALQRLQKLSVELGENVVGIGRAFLPEVESLDQLEEVVKIATALARFQPEQGILGARIALQEALAGEFRSLQRRFEISPAAIDKIRSAMESGGVTAGLEEIQAELERTGRSVEDLADTFSVSIGRVRERFRQLGQDLGTPLLEELKDQFTAIDEELEKLEPQLSIIADAFGEVLARIAEIIGTYIADFLEDFDPMPLLDVADAAHRVVNAFGLIIDVLGGGEGAATAFGGAMDGIAGKLIILEEWLLKVGKRLSEFRNDFRNQSLDFYEDFENLLQISRLLQGAGFGFAPGEAIGADPAAQLERIRKEMDTLREADDIEPFDWDAAIAANAIANQEFTNSLLDSVDAMGEADTQGEILANRFLKITQSLEELDALQQQYAESQEKVNEAIKEFNIQAALKFEKILVDARRARLEFEIQAAQKTLDMERKNSQKIADIRTKYNQNIIDAAQDLIDREADIARKHGDSLLDLEDERNKKRLEAEEKYLEALEKLRDKFNFQAFEAMLANDAKQLRQIRRRQAFEEGQLKKDKDRDLGDIDKDIEDRRKKLDLALERELRDSRIANARKIRDLEDNLKQQLDKQEEARRRELEQQGIAEKRKRDELNDALNKQLEDYDTWWQERYRVTTEGIAADLEAMQGYVDQANGILGTLGKAGIEFDPITGEPRLIYSPATIAETESPETAALREQLIEAQLYYENLGRRGGERFSREEIAADFEGLGITELVEIMKDLASDMEGYFDVTDFLGEEQDRLIDQAIFLGGQVGFSEEDILGELPRSLQHLREWIDEFVSVYTPRELPPFSLFGDISQGPLGQPGLMTPVPGLPFGAISPADFTPLPGVVPPPAGVPAPYQPPYQMPYSPYPGMVMPTAGITGISGPDLMRIPQAVPGQTPFIFPGVTQAPYVVPEDFDFVPDLGQLLMGFGGLTPPAGAFQGVFQPQNLMPISPAYGFSAADWQQQLDDEVQDRAIAELAKRGEIQDTIAFAELLAEKENLALAALLNEQTYDRRVASDEQIAIVEEALARQQLALAELGGDTALEEEAKTTETAIGILEAALEQMREDQAAATAALIIEETAAVEEAEEGKVDAVEGTTTAILQEVDERGLAQVRALDGEVDSVQDAADEQVDIVGQQETDKTAIRDEAHLLELEGSLEHSEARQELEEDAFAEEIDLLEAHFYDFLRREEDWMENDLRLLRWWLLQRQEMINQAIGQLPGLPGGDGGPSLPGGGGTSPQASLSELQSLAISHADELGLLNTAMRNQIMAMAYDDLAAFVTYLQEQLPGYALGGGFGAGPVVVGEMGEAEVVQMGGAGKIDVFKDLLFRSTPAIGVGGVTHNDNSMNMGGFNIPDPRGMPPTYIRQVENIISNAIRQAWADKL